MNEFIPTPKSEQNVVFEVAPGVAAGKGGGEGGGDGDGGREEGESELTGEEADRGVIIAASDVVVAGAAFGLVGGADDEDEPGGQGGGWRGERSSFSLRMQLLRKMEKMKSSQYMLVMRRQAVFSAILLSPLLCLLRRLHLHVLPLLLVT